MKKMGLLTLSVSIGGLLALSSQAAQPVDAKALPLDTRAIESTHVPHLRSSNGGSSRKGGGGGSGGSTNTTVTFSGSAEAVGPLVIPTSTIPEAEEHIAVTPGSSSTLVSAISDFALRGGYNTTKYAVSFDNGVTWSESYVPLSGGAPATSDGQVWGANSDPVVAIDKVGNVYIADLYFNTTGNANGLYVSIGNVSAGGTLGMTIASTRPVAANLSSSTSTSEDKEWIAVDNSSAATSGNVYVSWTRFAANTDYIVFSRSTDHGQTWSAPLRISPTTQNGAVQGSQVAVGPNGEVYVVYEVFFTGGVRRQYLAKSTNGGVSFSTPAAVTPNFQELSFNSTYRKNSFAALAVSPTDGRVVMLYAAQVSSTVGAEVLFTQSTNGGSSFSTPLVLNDNSAGQQFFPAVDVDETGAIHTSWFDTRNSPTDTSYYDIYATKSTDGGTTFRPNARVTSGSIWASNASFIGDYSGIAAGGGYGHPVWTSGGFNNGRLQTSALQ